MSELSGPTATASRVSDDRFLDCMSSAADLVGGRRFREAEIEVLRALSIMPSDLRALKLLALVRFKLGRLDESRAICREIAARQPRDGGIRLKLGLIALKLDRVDESIQELETAARLAPDDPRPWSYLGFAYARRGERARAAAAFRRAGQETLARETETGTRAAPELETDAAGEAEAPEVSEASEAPEAPEDRLARPVATLAANGTLGLAPGARMTAGTAASSGVLPGAVPSRVFEDPSSSLGRGGSTAGAPVAPLVGFTVSRLGPPPEHSAWVGAAARLSITDGAYVRADAAVASAGVVRWEEANRRVHGRPTAERLGSAEAPFFRVRGRSGELFVAAPPGTGRLVPLQLEDDVLYLREDAVLAFEGTVSWEYGHIPRATVGMLQFRGRGLVAVCVRGEPGSVKVSPERPVQAAARNLLGWVGRVVAHGGLHDVGISSVQARLSSPGPLPITCEGEGVVLLDVEDRGGPALEPATFSRGGFHGPSAGPVSNRG